MLPETWASPRYRDHPLVGRLWDVGENRFVGEAALEAAVAGADLVLLGETHDNPDHHLLQARLLRGLIAAGRRPAVAFEMLEVGQQAAIDAALARSPRTPDALAEAVEWGRSGWPDFSLYRPVFAAALDARLPIVAANLPRDVVREVMRQGPSALVPELRERLDRGGPLPPEVQRALREEMQENHCGQLPEALLDPMVLAQRARDVEMASRVLAAGAQGGAVLVTGAGHARVDRGVAHLLARDAPERTVRSIAFLEVSPESRTPADYAPKLGLDRLPFHVVAFTPAAERGDPCQELRQHPPRPLHPPRRPDPDAPRTAWLDAAVQ